MYNKKFKEKTGPAKGYTRIGMSLGATDEASVNAKLKSIGSGT